MKRLTVNVLAGVGVAAILGAVTAVVVVKEAKKKEWAC